MVVTAGKIGIYDAVEAATGRFVFSIDLGLQNIVTGIDPETGEKSIDASRIPDDRSVKLVCPHGAGVKNYPPASYNPASKVVFAPLTEACMDVFPIPGGAGRGALSSGVNWGIRPHPRAATASTDVCEAINLETRKTRLGDARSRADDVGRPRDGGRRRLRRRVRSVLPRLRRGDRNVLWQTRLNDVSSATPITYSVGGKQYLAVTTGQGGFHAASYAVLVPELVSPPDRGAMLWVFELP